MGEAGGVRKGRQHQWAMEVSPRFLVFTLRILGVLSRLTVVLIRLNLAQGELTQAVTIVSWATPGNCASSWKASPDTLLKYCFYCRLVPMVGATQISVPIKM